MENGSAVFEKNPNGSNYVIECDGFYLSYNPAPFEGSGVFAGDKGSDETALRIEQGGAWLILNGDYRTEYEEAVRSGGLDACVAVYESHRAVARSTWSNDSTNTASVAEWLAERARNVTND